MNVDVQMEDIAQTDPESSVLQGRSQEPHTQPSTFESIFQKLPDLRAQLPGDKKTQNFLLQRQSLAPYQDIAPKTPDSVPETAGLDVLVQVIRIIYSVLSPANVWIDQSTAVATEEKRNPLLRLAWSDIKEVAPHQLSGPGEEDRARFYVLKEFFARGPIGFEDRSFLSLVEHVLMHETLWMRHPLLLFSPSLPVKSTEEVGKWDFQELNGKILAEDSLVKWDGVGDLGNFISLKFGHKICDEAKMECIWIFNKPVVMRVLYTESKGNEARAWQELREVSLKVPKIDKTDQSGHKWRFHAPGGGNGESESITYRFIANVILRKEEVLGSADAFRSYTPAGEPIPPSRKSSLSKSHVKLGEAGQSYMLFYVRIREGFPALTSFPEILDDSVNTIVDTRAAEKVFMGIGME